MRRILLVFVLLRFATAAYAQMPADSLQEIYNLKFKEELAAHLLKESHSLSPLEEFKRLVNGRIYDRIMCCAEMLPGREEGELLCAGCNAREALDTNNWHDWGRRTNKFVFDGDSLIRFVFILFDSSESERPDLIGLPASSQIFWFSPVMNDQTGIVEGWKPVWVKFKDRSTALIISDGILQRPVEDADFKGNIRCSYMMYKLAED
jgi:hypothetical protein